MSPHKTDFLHIEICTLGRMAAAYPSPSHASFTECRNQDRIIHKVWCLPEVADGMRVATSILLTTLPCPLFLTWSCKNSCALPLHFPSLLPDQNGKLLMPCRASQTLTKVLPVVRVWPLSWVPWHYCLLFFPIYLFSCLFVYFIKFLIHLHLHRRVQGGSQQ